MPAKTIQLEPGQIAIICTEQQFQQVQEAMIIADDHEATDYYENFIKTVTTIKN